jgi:hypothetical protein
MLMDLDANTAARRVLQESDANLFTKTTYFNRNLTRKVSRYREVFWKLVANIPMGTIAA